MKKKYSNHFVNLEELVYKPLHSVAQSNMQLGAGIMELIGNMGTVNPTDDKDTIHLKTVNLAYEQINNDGSDGKVIEEIGLKVPLISLVPINGLKISKSKIAFDAEVKRTKRNKKSGICSMEARICSSGKQRRKDDGLAKLSFEIELEATDAPEGMARFVDILNANPIPETLSSRRIDDNGEVITGDAAAYYQNIASLKQRELRLNQMGERLLDLIATKKLNFDQLLHDCGEKSTFDTLCTSDADKDKETLDNISCGNETRQKFDELYHDITEGMYVYRRLMDRSMELSGKRIRAELEHIKEEAENGEQEERNT